VPDLIDYSMPENGVFHNLILAKIKTLYPGHSKQAMHAFWGVGQMSFVKHAIFVDEDAPDLEDFDKLSSYILDRFSVKNMLITEGVCDALDHSSDTFAYGGKLGIDATSRVETKEIEKISDEELLKKLQEIDNSICKLKQYKIETKTPIAVAAIEKDKSIRSTFEELKSLKPNVKVLVFVDSKKNDINNAYMLIWRVVNNIDAKRDIFIDGEFVVVDATNKGKIDGFNREWPDDTDCTKEVIEDLRQRGLLDIDEEFIKKFYIY
jgi:4-hydroxy-3-polyprenylbenzoate decarboxylase